MSKGEMILLAVFIGANLALIFHVYMIRKNRTK